jgi:hypothetical protein
MLTEIDKQKAVRAYTQTSVRTSEAPFFPKKWEFFDLSSHKNI